MSDPKESTSDDKIEAQEETCKQSIRSYNVEKDVANDVGLDLKTGSRCIREPTFIIAVAFMFLIGAFNPLLSKSLYFVYTYPCPSWVECSMEKFSSLLLLVWVKYVFHLILSALFYFGLDVSLLHNRGRSPFLSKSDDIQNSKYAYSFYTKFLVTSLLDVGFTVFNRWAVIYTRPSTIQVTKSLQILTAVFADMLLMKKGVTIIKMIGVALALTGMITYGTGTMIADPIASSLSQNSALGISFAAVAATFRGFHSSIQGRNMRLYCMPPTKMLFVESIYGTIIVSFIILITKYTRETFYGELWSVLRSPKLCGMVSLFGINCFLFNCSATIVGKYSSGLFRMMLCQTASLFLYIIEVSLGWSPITVITVLGWALLLSGMGLYGGPKCLQRRRPILFRPMTCRGRLTAPEDAIFSANQLMRIENRSDLCHHEPDYV